MTQFEMGAVPPQGASVIPVLNTLIPADQISHDLASALDLRDAERAAFMTMTEEVSQSLRPELERLTTELVQRSLQQAWRSKFRNSIP